MKTIAGSMNHAHIVVVLGIVASVAAIGCSDDTTTMAGADGATGGGGSGAGGASVDSGSPATGGSSGTGGGGGGGSTHVDASTSDAGDGAVSNPWDALPTDATDAAAAYADAAPTDSAWSDGASGDGTTDGAVSTFAAIAPLFAACTRCHTGTSADGGTRSPPGGLDMTTNGIYASLYDIVAPFCQDRKYVDPGRPDTSYLVNALTGTFPADSASCTNNHVDGGRAMFQMPPSCSPDGGTPSCFTQEQIALVRAWISAGAQP